MYSKSGKIIKVLAITFTVLGVVGSCISGGVMIHLNETTNLNIPEVYSLLAIFVGSILSFLSNICLYGFGQLIDNSGANRRMLEKLSADKNTEQDVETHAADVVDVL